MEKLNKHRASDAGDAHCLGHLIDEALDDGSLDNMTCALVKFKGMHSPLGLFLFLDLGPTAYLTFCARCKTKTKLTFKNRWFKLLK